MTVKELLSLLVESSDELVFEQVMQVIDDNYDYLPTRFTNGDVINEAGSNEGSCKLFAFAQLHGLTEQQALNGFAQHYRDVLADPDGSGHQNIRAFMTTGWAGVEFSGSALTSKAKR